MKTKKFRNGKYSYRLESDGAKYITIRYFKRAPCWPLNKQDSETVVRDDREDSVAFAGRAHAQARSKLATWIEEYEKKRELDECLEKDHLATVHNLAEMGKDKTESKNFITNSIIRVSYDAGGTMIVEKK